MPGLGSAASARSSPLETMVLSPVDLPGTPLPKLGPDGKAAWVTTFSEKDTWPAFLG